MVPAVCGVLFCRGILPRLLVGWGIGLLGSVLGLFLSVQADLPTGPSIVTTFGALLVLCALLRALRQRAVRGK